MRELLEPTQDPSWILSHDGYDVLSESAIESRLAFGNGFLGMRAARSVSRGPTWVAWLGYSRWASWPRCYVAGLFDVPNTEPPVPALVPVADWSRVRILLDRCWRAKARCSSAPANSTCAADYCCRLGRIVPPRASPPRDRNCAFCRSRTAQRGCNFCGSRLTATGSM